MVHPGRIVGFIMGLLILFSIAALPFDTNQSMTFLEIGLPIIQNINVIPNLGDAASITFAYILAIAFILLIAAGFVGVFPLGTGVLGIVGMALVTFAAVFLVPTGIPAPSWGLGYYVMWGASIVSLGASFWHGKSKQQSSTVIVNVYQNASKPSILLIKCRNCGTTNPVDSKFCNKCGQPLTEK